MSVEDEWKRFPESTKNLDLLFVTFDPRKISIKALKETITKHKFKAEIRDEAKD